MHPAFKLYLISDRQLAADHGGLPSVIERALAGAASIAEAGRVAVQLREKELDARRLIELGRALRVICSKFGAPLLVNDRIDVAIAIGADGVHLPANSFPAADARAMVGPARMIGVSAHRADEIALAAAAGADFAVFGPVYDPISKGRYADARGIEGLTQACRAAELPVYALGGITAERIREIGASVQPGAARPAGVAVIGAVMDAADPAASTRAMLVELAKW